MLLEFMVQNFRSIYTNVRLGMLSTRGRELPEHKISISKKMQCNKLGVIFGPNASGKSNILRALFTMGAMVDKLGVSRETSRRFPYFYEPFVFSDKPVNEPTMFQATYYNNGKYFRYGYKYNSKEILEEWLLTGKLGNETPVFTRINNNFDYIDSKIISEDEERILKKQISSNNLILSIGADLKIQLFMDGASFYSNFSFHSDTDMPLALMVNDDKLLQILTGMLIFADTGVMKIERRKIENSLINLLPSSNEKLANLITALKEYADENPQINEMMVFLHGGLANHEWILPEFDESRGTSSFLRLLITFCTALKTGGLAIIDEIEESLHPLLVARAFQFFTSFNNGAQLICTSHAPVIFSTKVVRRDELYIIEKSKYGETFVKRASDFKDARNDGNLTRRYLEGRFGGVPLMNNKKMLSVIGEVNEYLDIN